MFYNIWPRGLYYKTFYGRNLIQYASAFAIVSHFLMALTNALAFYVTELITAVISFMIQALGANVIKLFCA
jgi:hypothetical protein